jgi:hypothetical protein
MSFYKYDNEGNVIRNRVTIDCQKAVEEGEEIRVEQSHVKEVNINNIVRKYGADLVQNVQHLQNLVFDDVTTNDFQENMNMLLQAKERFDAMPDKIRKRFDYQPAMFMDFIRNPDNKEEMYDLGLAKKPVQPLPVQVAVVSEPETPPPDKA